MECLQGSNLLQYSRCPHKLRAFLEPRADRLGRPSDLYKSIIVLRGAIGSSLQMTLRSENSEWPMLRRTGQYPPSMLIPELGNIISVDPNEQRIGCDYIDHERAANFIARMFIRVRSLYRQFDPNAAPSSQRFDAKELFNSELDAAAERLSEFFFKGRREFISEAEFKHLLCERLRKEEAKLSTAPVASSSNEVEIEEVERGFRLLESALQSSTHTASAIRNISSRSRHAQFRHIVLQGCGDVSMNFWNICYLAGDGGEPARIVHVPTEPVDDRVYSSLICWDWKSGEAERIKAEIKGQSPGQLFSAGAPTPSLSIGRLRINQYGNGGRLRLITGGKPIEIAPCVQYVVYGRRLAWDGQLTLPRSVATEFSDLRHLLDLPNLNPDERQLPPDVVDGAWAQARQAAQDAKLSDLISERIPDVFRSKPRYMFQNPAQYDVWLAEHFLRDSPAMVQHACEYPIEIPASELGAPRDWVTLCLIKWGYRLRSCREEVAARSDFTWDTIDPANPKLVIFFRMASYPCTLVGIGKLGAARHTTESSAEGGDLFLLAWGHAFRKDQEYSVFDCAQFLVDLGAQAVLLIDEGRDVFQHVFTNYGQLERYEQELGWASGNVERSAFPVPADREQIRATLAFWVGPHVSSGRR